MTARHPTFKWPRFLISFIAAPILVTAATFWMFIPIYALIFGGPLYLVAGMPIAAWYLRRHPPRILPVLLLAQASQLLQIPVFLALAAFHGDWSMLNPLPAFLVFGALFALLWTSAFLALYNLLARAERPSDPKEPPDVHP